MKTTPAIAAAATLNLAVMVLGCAPPASSPPSPSAQAVTVAETPKLDGALSRDPRAKPQPPADAAPPDAGAPAPAAAPIDPAADPDELALVRSICQAAIKHEGGAVRVGCRTCPPFDGAREPDQPDGQVVVDPGPFWAVEHMHHGAFSRPGADEVAAVFAGCEDHAGNFGGTVFAEKAGGGYRTLRYVSAFHPAACQVYRRPDRRDELVCRWWDAHQTASFTQVLSFDLARATAADPRGGWDTLAMIHDNSQGVCLGLTPDSGIQQGELLGFRFEDRNGDGIPDLVVDVLRRSTPYSSGLAKAVHDRCSEAMAAGRTDMTIDVPALVGKPQKETLELLFDGNRFKPTPATAARLPRL